MIHKRYLTVLLVFCLLVSALANADGDVTNAEKLWKQLEAGSGFSGSFTVDIADHNGNTLLKKPFEGTVTYIYVRPDEENAVEGSQHLTLALNGEDGQVADAALHLENGAGYLESSLLGKKPLQISGNNEGEAVLFGGLDPILNQIGMPSLIKLCLGGALGFQSSTRLNNALDTLALDMDVWLEGYRKGTVLGKTEDGKSILTVSYTIPSDEIKVQLKQLLKKIFENPDQQAVFVDALNHETALAYFNEDYYSYYCDAIDALPLEGEAVLERTVYISGGTASIHLSLPLYDAAAGRCTITYDQQCGREDELDETTITLQSGLRSILVSYQRYVSMTGVSVIQGEIHSDPVGSSKEKSLSLGFVLTGTHQQETNADSLGVYSTNWTLAVTPLTGGNDEYAVPSMEVVLDAAFTSGVSQKSATEISMALVIGGDDLEYQVTVTLDGKSRKKWDVEPIRSQVVELSAGEAAKVLEQLQEVLRQLRQNFLLSDTSEKIDQIEAGVEVQ